MPDPDVFADMQFPKSGVDLTRGFEKQVPGSTATGVNVQLFEPTTDRARGGSRPMLSPYILPQVPAGPRLIQHLNYVVDPRADALLASIDLDPSANTVDDPSTNPPGSDPNNPSDFRVRNRGNKIPVGGFGVQPNRNVKIKKKSTNSYTWIDFDSESTFTGTPSGDPTLLTVVKNDLIVLAACSDTSLGASVTDSLGNTWSLLQTVVPSGGIMRMWWTKAIGSGVLDATLTIGGNWSSVISQWRPSNPSSVALDSSAQLIGPTQAGGSVVNYPGITGPTVNASTANDLVIAAYVVTSTNMIIANSSGPAVNGGLTFSLSGSGSFNSTCRITRPVADLAEPTGTSLFFDANNDPSGINSLSGSQTDSFSFSAAGDDDGHGGTYSPGNLTAAGIAVAFK